MYRIMVVEGSRILTPQGPHLHVTGTVSLKSYPLDWEKTLYFFILNAKQENLEVACPRFNSDNNYPLIFITPSSPKISS
jgi:hypothetical protein